MDMVSAGTQLSMRYDRSRFSPGMACGNAVACERS